jgi:hypothetical protein
MAVTPNYNWPIPVATDYVKDGYDAIADLGNAIDTTVAGLSGGLNLITSTTFTAQSTAIIVNNCFSSTYTNYRIVVDYKGDSAAATGCSLRLRTTSDDTNSVYDAQDFGASVSSTFAGLYTGLTSWAVSGGNRVYFLATIDLFSPNVNAPTRLISQSASGDTNWGSAINLIKGGEHRNNYQATGFSMLIPVTSSGTVKVYGYKD